MIARIGARAACAVVIVAEAGVACTPIPSASDSYAAPANMCPTFSCAEYSSGSAATCQGGACVVSAPTSSTDGLIVVVAVPTDSSYAPGRTFAVTLQDLLAPSTSNGCSAPDCCFPDCCLPDCAPLPGIEIVSRLYVIEPSLESATNGGVDFDLGNPGQYTALPAQATYQPLWGGPSGPYATSVGLPLAPIQALAFPSPGPTYPGPDGSASIVVQTYLQTGMSYQLTDQPDPPFSAAYPPEVFTFTPTGTGDAPIATLTNQFDLTSGTIAAEAGDAGPSQIPTETLPTFDLSRAAGLDGWTAYLRDATNLNTVSNVVALAGTESPHVVLATNRFGGSGTDALTNVQLVVAPPEGVVAPTDVLTPAGGELPSTETYPPMPDPVSVTVAVTAGKSGAGATGLTFEATSVLVGGVETISNFTYTMRVSTEIDASTGRSIFSVQLPPGQYLVVARPVAGAPASSAVTLAALDAPEFGPYVAPAIALASTQLVSGIVDAADMRPLSQATIEAIPAACAPLPGGLYDSPFLSMIACLPRSAQTTTAADGSFSLALDPGQYLLRVQPADGTRFPWVTRSISVANDSVTLERIVVPLPVSVGLRLVDPNDNPIVQALVSVYSLPASGPAIEIGSALTDGNGQYEMFVALAQP